MSMMNGTNGLTNNPSKIPISVSDYILPTVPVNVTSAVVNSKGRLEVVINNQVAAYVFVC